MATPRGKEFDKVIALKKEDRFNSHVPETLSYTPPIRNVSRYFQMKFGVCCKYNGKDKRLILF